MVSVGAAHDEPVVDAVSRQAVTEAHHAQPVPDDSEDVQHIVCQGFPVTGMDVRIARDGTAQGPREIGAIELRGPAVARSYLTSDGAIPLARRDGWFDTGDLGYLDEEGRVYVCGRRRISSCLPGRICIPRISSVRPGTSTVCARAALSRCVDAEREGFAVLAEVHNADDEDVRLRIRREIRARVNSQVGHAPREVRLFPAGSLPKTASGKLRRNNARELLTQQHAAQTLRATSR